MAVLERRWATPLEQCVLAALALLLTAGERLLPLLMAPARLLLLALAWLPTWAFERLLQAALRRLLPRALQRWALRQLQTLLLAALGQQLLSSAAWTLVPPPPGCLLGMALANCQLPALAQLALLAALARLMVAVAAPACCPALWQSAVARQAPRASVQPPLHRLALPAAVPAVQRQD